MSRHLKSSSYELGLVESVAAIGQEVFAGLEGPERFPFLRYEWLDAFERSGCLGAERGWVPRHVVVRRGKEIVAVAPAYIKLNSMGEFVFDHQIAEFAESRLGVRYYPKLILAVPFTPATGPRVLFASGADQRDREAVFERLTGALPDLCKKAGISSAHVLFPDAPQAAELAARGWALREGIQFQFKNEGCTSFDDYLATFRAKQRAIIRRERRELTRTGLEIVELTGAALAALEPRLAYELYLTTVDKFVWGRRYLTPAFFERVLVTMPDAIHVVLARAGDGEPLAGAFNLLGAEALYGRYWGAFREVKYLHFEVCLYRGVEATIARGLSRFEPGAGGEHKESRGFSATVTRSVHYYADARLDQAVRDFYSRERESVEARVAGD